MTATDTGWVIAGSGLNYDDGSYTAWTSPGNVTADNATYATADPGTGKSTQYLRGYNFGLSTSGGILGVEVRYQVHVGGAGSSNYNLRIGKSASDKGTLEVDSLSLTVTPTNYDFGSSTDLWGYTTLSPTDVNSSNFLVELRFDDDRAYSVDAIWVKVHYDPNLHTLAASNLTVGSPVIATPTWAQDNVLSAVALTTQSWSHTTYRMVSPNQSSGQSGFYFGSAVGEYPQVTFGEALVEVIAETAQLAEAQTVALALFRYNADTTNVGEVSLNPRGLLRPTLDGTLNISDASARARVRSQSEADSVSASEASARARARSQIEADSVSASEARNISRAIARIRDFVVNAGEAWDYIIPHWLRPTTTIVQGSWTNELSGSNLHGSVDETSPLDSDYIKSSENPVSDACVLNVSPYTYELRDPIKLRIRARAVEGGSLVAKLWDGDPDGGGTLIATRSFSGISATYQTFEWVLTTQEASDLNASVDRRLQLTADYS